MGKRDDVTSYAYRQIRASILSESDVCVLCGHAGSDAIDHLFPVSRGGDEYDRANMAPIHGVKGCVVCLRKCNNEKSDKTLEEMDLNPTSRDWFQRV